MSRTQSGGRVPHVTELCFLPPPPQILKVSKVADRTQSIFEDAFSTLGRLDNISVVMGFHPHYLESFLRTQHYLLQMDGPLSLHYRHYIGIMVLDDAPRPPLTVPPLAALWLTPLPPLPLQAAARHQCSYLVNLHVNDFLQVGGDPKWLNGLDEAPRKLQPLGELNKILAHRPWLLTKEHIEVRGWPWPSPLFAPPQTRKCPACFVISSNS